MNYNDSIFRIKKYPRGWVVEVKKSKWTFFGIKHYWTHYISVSGIPEQPWYFSFRKFAEYELLKEIKFSVA